MNERDFKELFTVVFLAGWCANEYGDACSYGQQERLESPPVDDAIYLAESAWDKAKERMT